MLRVGSVPFGELLRRFRLAAGLSQEALAERAGISARAVSDLERGVKTTPHRDTVQLLADALDLSSNDRAMFETTVVRRRGPSGANPPGGPRPDSPTTGGEPGEQGQVMSPEDSPATHDLQSVIADGPNAGQVANAGQELDGAPEGSSSDLVMREQIVRERIVRERTIHEREVRDQQLPLTNDAGDVAGTGSTEMMVPAPRDVAVLEPHHDSSDPIISSAVDVDARAAPPNRSRPARRFRVGVGGLALLSVSTALVVLLGVIPRITCGTNPTMSAYWQARQGLCHNFTFQCLPSDPVARGASAVAQIRCQLQGVHGAVSPHLCYFAATQHNISGPFLSFWLRYGGLTTFGYPRTEPYRQDGVLVQYTDRFLLVQQEDGQVTTDNLGMRLASDGDTRSVSPFTSTPTHRYFAQTGHSMGGTGDVEAAILSFWQSHHGAQLLGAPISEVTTQTNDDGSCRTYPVQWFERGRLEYHVEIVNPRYRVEVGLLGRQDLRRQGWLP